MAFEKRTWLARIGTGLNKFIIGAKDANNKQTLENSPDSVTQQGDVISADNLNDLEDRIEAGMNSMKLTKVWENESPDSSFSAQTVSINGVMTDIVIEYKFSTTSNSSRLFHIKNISGNSVNYITEITYDVAPNFIVNSYRKCTVDITPTTTELDFGTGSWIQGGAINTSNARIIPLAIYKVGDIYNS